MRLVVDDQDVAAGTEHAGDKRGVALDVAGHLHERLRHGARGVFLLADHPDPAGSLRRRIAYRRVVPVAAHRGALAGDDDPLLRRARHAALVHPRTGARRLRVEDVPVGDEHAPQREVGHHRRRHEVARAVQAGVPGRGIKLAEARADRHVRTDDQHRVGKSRIAPIGHLVENRPRGEHRGDGALAGAGRHLRALTAKARVAFGDAVLGGRIEGDVDALQEVGARLGEEDHGLDRFALGEEQAGLAAFAIPPLDQFGGRAGDAGTSGLLPFAQAVADQVDERHLLPDAPAAAVVLHVPLWVAVVVAGGPAAGQFLRRFTLFEAPITRGFVERRVEDRVGDFEATGHRISS